MRFLGLGDPVGVFLAGHRRLVECRVLGEFLPFRQRLHLLEQVDVVGDLVGLDATRHEDAAQHQVLDVEALRLAGGNVFPRHRRRHLVRIGHLLRVEHAQRAQCACAPMRDGLDRIVHRRVDVLADELHGDVATALVRDVGELLADRLLQRDGDDLVFLLRTRAAHLEVAVGFSLDRRHVVAGGLVRRLGIHPQHELVERQHRHRRQVLPAERHARRHRRGEQVRQRDDQLVRVALVALHVEEALGAGAARFVDDDHRLRHQVVLGDHALQEARHLVGAAAGAGRHDEFDGLGGRPRAERDGRQRGTDRERRRQCGGTTERLDGS